MAETFEFRICDADGSQRRVFVNCRPEDVVRIAHLRMAQHAAPCVEVWGQGEHLATLEAPEALAERGA